MCGNMTSISYTNNMGDTIPHSCNKIGSNVWDFCITEKLWISAAHIPGVSDKEADKHSSILDNCTDWQLSLDIFGTFVKFGMELFGWHIYKQLDNSVHGIPKREQQQKLHSH